MKFADKKTQRKNRIEKIGRINKMTFEGFEFSEMIVTYPDPNAYMDSMKLGLIFRHGTLGGEVLSRFTVIFDYANEKLYLKKNAAYRKSFE